MKITSALVPLLLAAILIVAAASYGIAGAQTTTDYDTDGDGLIEISNLDQLNAIRWDLNGNGNPDLAEYIDSYNAAFPNRDNTADGLMGCPQAACKGYELMANLDFDTDGDNDVDADDGYPNWTPIPTYKAEFHGNGHTITRLTINTNARFAGLFGILGQSGHVSSVGMVDASVSGGGSVGDVGILVGRNRGWITFSYIQGGSVAVTSDRSAVGGMVGANNGSIQYAYSTASVSGGNRNYALVGGLVGVNYSQIGYTYTAGAVSGATTTAISGGLIGVAYQSISDSFCDITVTMHTKCVGNLLDGATATSTRAMQSPTDYTGIYSVWYSSIDLWNFGTASQYPTLNYEARTVTDYDADNDGLIDVSTLAQLNAIRWDLGGYGLTPDFFSPSYRRDLAALAAYDAAFPNRDYNSMGCPDGCRGYELITNLDFDTDGDNDVDTNDEYPNWAPIGFDETFTNGYGGEFDGNGHTITRLTSSSTDIRRSGLFGTLYRGGSIRNVGMIDASVRGWGGSVGILVGHNYGTITASYARGGSVGVNATSSSGYTYLGGLAGINFRYGVIQASYSTASVNNSGGEDRVRIGGLVGWNYGGGEIIASYAAGALSSATATTPIGGVAGVVSSGRNAIANSYYDTGVTGQSQAVGDISLKAFVTAAGHSSSTLRTPTGYTGIYAQWNIDLDGDGVGDDPWNFGTSGDYPTPKVVRVAELKPEPKPEPALAQRVSAAPVASSIEPGNSDEPGATAPEAYNPQTAHPEIYANPSYRTSASCAADGDDAVITFDLGRYAGPVALWLSLWDGAVFAGYATHGIAVPPLERNGQKWQVRITTDPAQTRFRLDGRRHGLAANLVLGYADCHTDDP